MTSTTEEHSQILTELGEAGRGWSDAIVLFHTAMAERFGLNLTDWKCGGILDQRGPMTAGELAKATGLTTGAITGVIDRLEAAGFARREQDRNDRRRIIVHIVPEMIAKTIDVFGSMLGAMGELTAGYSRKELEVILDFIRKAAVIISGETEKLRRENEGRQTENRQKNEEARPD